MKLKNPVLMLMLTILAALNMVFFYSGIAYAESYSVKISCIIPAVAGKNMPIIQEPGIANMKVQVNSPVIFQKDTQEIRIIAGEKHLINIETLYSR